MTIPESVTKIDLFAFSDCTSLSTINIPDQTIHILSDAFYNTKWYSDQPNGIIYLGKIAYGYKGKLPPEITIRDGTLAIAGYAFSFSEITAVSLPDSLELIGDGAFAYCYELQSVDIPNSVTYIGESAFDECESLASVKLSKNLQEIGSYAFAGCVSLENLFIPGTVIRIGINAFIGCSNLTLTVIENTYPEYYAIDNDIPYVLTQETIPGLTFSDGFVYGIPKNLTCSDVLANYSNNITIYDAKGNAVTDLKTPVTTGFVIDFNMQNYTVVIMGDVNGDGVVDSVDCLVLKRAILGNTTLEGAYLRAACVSGGEFPDSTDYLNVKRHVIGTYNLFQN